MALIQSIWLPRRGKKSTMNGTKKIQVLAKGEFFAEYPDSGIGTGHGKAKLGDGVTDYEHLPYFLGDTENEKITFSSNTSNTVAAALNAVVSGATLKNIIAGLKQAIVQSDARVTKLNDDFAKLSDSFRDGCNIICRHITSLGVNTPDNSAVSTITTNITTLYNSRYTTGYNQGVTDADARANPSSVNYQTGYNKGVTDADARVNTSSASYTNGYNTGYAAGRAQGQADVIANPGAYGISTGINISAGMNAFFDSCTKILTGEPTKASATATAPNVAKHCRCEGEWFWQGYLLRSHGWTQVTYNWQIMSPNYPIGDYDHTVAYEKDIDVKPYRADYASLTINDFWFRCTEFYGQPDGSPNEDGADYPQCVSYNPANGILHVRVFTSEDYGSIGYHGNFICLKPAA